MLDPNNDWPENTLRTLSSWPYSAEETAMWVQASPRRAFTGDGSELWIARRRRMDGGYAKNMPPSPDEKGIPTIDMLSESVGGYLELHPEVEVESLAWQNDGFDVALRLSTALASQFQSSEEICLHLVPGALGPGVWGREEGSLNALVKLIAVGGAATPAMMEAVERIRRQEELEQQALARQRSVMYATYRASAVASGRYGVPAPLRPLFDQALEKRKLTQYSEVIADLALPALALTTTKDSPDAVGVSRLGGTPDLPSGEVWAAEDGRLYTFVAQLNLADLPILPELDLPRQGLLSFYAGACESANDPGGLVRYYEGTVVPTPVPEKASFIDENQEGILIRKRLCITPAVSLPGYGNDAFDAMELPVKLAMRYYKIPSMLFDAPKRPRAISGVNTYPESLGSDTISEQVFAQYQQPDPRDWARETLERKVAEGEKSWAARLAAHDWWTAHAEEVAGEMHAMICLLDLDSHLECGMSWWDAGRLIFLIHRDDLQARRFERTRIVLVTS